MQTELPGSYSKDFSRFKYNLGQYSLSAFPSPSLSTSDFFGSTPSANSPYFFHHRVSNPSRSPFRDSPGIVNLENKRHHWKNDSEPINIALKFPNSVKKNIYNSLMSAIKNWCKNYFEGKGGNIYIKCISIVLKDLSDAEKEDFKNFIYKYNNKNNTFQKIKAYISEEGNDKVTITLIRIISELLSYEYDEDLDQWLNKSKLSAKKQSYIRKNRFELTQKFLKHIWNRKYGKINLNKKTNQVLIIQQSRPIEYEVLGIPSSSQENIDNDDLQTTLGAKNLNIPGTILTIIIKGLRNCLNLKGNKLEVRCVLKIVAKLDEQERKELIAYVEAGRKKQTWKGIRDEAKAYPLVIDLLRYFFTRILSDESYNELRSLLNQSQLSEDKKEVILNFRDELQKTARKYLY